MKSNKILSILIASLFIALSFPLNAFAADNEFTAQLSVSPTQVATGSTVTSTITVTNKDTTYGADISVSYEGQHIKSFYLAPGQQSSFEHNIIINENTNIYYTVNASHGPDISNTKQTNTVSVSIIQPSTPTPTPTAVITNTHTPSPTPTATATSTATPTATLTATPTLLPEDSFTPEPSQSADSNDNETIDDKTGWSAFISLPQPTMKVFSGLYGTNILKWLGINNDTVNIVDESTSELSPSTLNLIERIYNIRRLLFAVLSLVLLSSIIISIILIIKPAKKNNSVQ